MTQKWIRVQDFHGQFDHPEGAPLPPNSEVVPDYPEHYGLLPRHSKPRTSKDGGAPKRAPRPLTPEGPTPPADAGSLTD